MTDRTCETCRHCGDYSLDPWTKTPYCDLALEGQTWKEALKDAARAEGAACGPEGKLWEAKRRRFWGLLG